MFLNEQRCNQAPLFVQGSVTGRLIGGEFEAAIIIEIILIY
jgi:hypothetical protein